MKIMTVGKTYINPDAIDSVCIHETDPCQIHFWLRGGGIVTLKKESAEAASEEFQRILKLIQDL